MGFIRLARLSIVVLFLLLAPSARAFGAEFYYLLLFGSQTSPKQLRYSHTWGTFVKATGEGTDPDAYTLEAHTISWVPATLDVHVWRHWPEPGVNLDHDQTMQFVLANKESVKVWGPFRISQTLWEHSLEVRDLIASGQVKYRAISTAGNRLVSDCIHALATVDPKLGEYNYPLIRIGKPATRYFARSVMVRSGFDQTAEDHSWLIPRLGVDRYPIEIVPPTIIPKRLCFLCLIPE